MAGNGNVRRPTLPRGEERIRHSCNRRSTSGARILTGIGTLSSQSATQLAVRTGLNNAKSRQNQGWVLFDARFSYLSASWMSVPTVLTTCNADKRRETFMQYEVECHQKAML